MFVFDWVTAVITIAAGIAGFIVARRFVARRLRFVDAIYNPSAPFIIAALGMLITWPISALPLVSATASALFGIGAGLGTASGVKVLRRGTAVTR
jgi:predicted MPP superfamily phosphohydrolase